MSVEGKYFFHAIFAMLQLKTNLNAQGVKVSVSAGFRMIEPNKIYVVKNKVTGKYLGDYDKDLNIGLFGSSTARGAIWISGSCISGIRNRYLIKIQDDIEIIEAPKRRYR